MNIMGDNLLGLFESEGGTIEKRGKTMINRRPTQYLTIPQYATVTVQMNHLRCASNPILYCVQVYI